jgi:hypothetical protein
MKIKQLNIPGAEWKREINVRKGSKRISSRSQALEKANQVKSQLGL